MYRCCHLVAGSPDEQVSAGVRRGQQQDRGRGGQTAGPCHVSIQTHPRGNSGKKGAHERPVVARQEWKIGNIH